MYKNTLKLEISKQLDIHPSRLCSNINDTILKLLKSKYLNSCSEHGIILDISCIKEMTNKISKDSCSVLFMVKFIADVIKPVENDEIVFNPIKIVEKGIFGKIHENINVFITSIDLNTNKFVFCDGSNPKYLCAADDKVINLSSKIIAVVFAIKYDANKYNCIVKFKNLGM